MAGILDGTARHGSRRAAQWLLALGCLLPVLAGASPQLQQRLDALREEGRFVPERALQHLKEIESEAFSAPLPLRAEYITQLSNAHMRLGQNDIALQLTEDLILDADQAQE